MPRLVIASVTLAKCGEVSNALYAIVTVGLMANLTKKTVNASALHHSARRIATSAVSLVLMGLSMQTYVSAIAMRHGMVQNVMSLKALNARMGVWSIQIWEVVNVLTLGLALTVGSASEM